MDKRLFLFMIISIFSSLAAGILIGTELATDRELLSRQAGIILAIEGEFYRLQQAHEQLQARVTELDRQLVEDREVEEQLARRLVQDSLVGAEILLVEWDRELAERVREVLAVSGANVHTAEDDGHDAVVVVVGPEGVADGGVDWSALKGIGGGLPVIAAVGDATLASMVPVPAVGNVGLGRGALELCLLLAEAVGR